MLSAKNFLPSDKTLNIRLKCMKKGSALPHFFEENGAKPAKNYFSNDPAFAPMVNDFGNWAGAIWQWEMGHS